MVAVRRALLVQVSGLVVVGILLFVLSRFLPLADLLAEVQERVMHWGAWSAICYPLLYACCNVLLLPGGFLSIGGGFFFGLWWGFFIILVGNSFGTGFFWGGVTIASLIGVIALSLLELFVACLQAYIFTFLTALFMGMSLHHAEQH